jgi:hypothetical protein
MGFGRYAKKAMGIKQRMIRIIIIFCIWLGILPEGTGNLSVAFPLD